MASRGVTARGWSGLISGALLVGALTACGADPEPTGTPFVDQPAKEIADASLKAMREAETVHLAGSLTIDGRNVEIDTTVDSDGNCEGRVSLGDQGATRLRQLDERLYLKPDKRFLTSRAGHLAAERITTAMQTKWLLVPGKGDHISWCHLDGLLNNVDRSLTETVPETGDQLKVEGHDAIELTQVEDDRHTSLFVESAEPHHLLKIASHDPQESGELSFSQFGADVDITIPAGGEVYDLLAQYGQVEGLGVDPTVASWFCRRFPWCQPTGPLTEPPP